ncbi:ThrRS/AlaRS common domain-containing protein [Coniochaeta ligniaria NRRL 30616]|uniref:ThrRS/AlaRS common domain-containing protein n=1 Tax=Coniochaeta ligniaria NRRL 30616 TaxID=1408157 RepID=A0A1J7IF76_9PEZI|nr:ThrRS/AlaRS common domain-containing protein [Coniochaeta ligniaria NRRL 30616]
MATTARTIARYQHDASLRELVTSVVAWHPLSTLEEPDRSLFKTVLSTSSGAVATKETIFHPQGGGQPSDRGTITAADDPSLQLDVSLVRKLPSGLILHAGSRAGTCSPATTTATAPPLFTESQSVVLKIDTPTRNHHSRLHTAGHLIGLAVRGLESAIGAVTELKANHAPGSAWVEFGGSIAGEHRDAIQAAVDAMVASDLPVRVKWWDAQTVKDKSMSGLAGVADLPEGEHLFRVVEVEGLGAYPCGGTHLPTTGDVGRVVVRKISRGKGKSKVSYEVEPGKEE